MRPIHGSNRFGLTVGPRCDPLAARGHFEPSNSPLTRWEAELNLGLIQEMAVDHVWARSCFEVFLAKASPAHHATVIHSVGLEPASIQKNAP